MRFMTPLKLTVGSENNDKNESEWEDEDFSSLLTAREHSVFANLPRGRY